MIRAMLAVFLISLSTALFAETPQLNIPGKIREANYAGGSCVHASTVTLLRWQRQYALASWWRSTYYGGETWPGWEAKANAANLKWASTHNNYDVAFLEKATETRRGCMVTKFGGRHMVTLVHLDKANVPNAKAGILDNNDISIIQWMPRDQFLAEWRASYSWAATVIYTPPPPALKRKVSQ